MKEVIKSKLDQIEKDRNIKILYAVESGSRAWGFASQDSDYDVRFIYVPDITYYFKVHNPRDVIEVMDGDLDFAGWELRKALGLLYKGNPPLLEWLTSPLIYKEDAEAVQELKNVSRGYYDAKKAIYHYIHMAEGNYRQYILNRSDVKLKKYLYVIRPILACLWIIKYSTMPPMEIARTLELLKQDKLAYEEISKLLKDKRSGVELGMGPKNPILNNFIDQHLNICHSFVRSLESEHKDIEPLNQYLEKYANKSR